MRLSQIRIFYVAQLVFMVTDGNKGLCGSWGKAGLKFYLKNILWEKTRIEEYLKFKNLFNGFLKFEL